MRKFHIALVLAVLIGFIGAVSAQPNVTIVYPINGGTYPISDPPPGALGSHYFTSSFSVTCSGGGHTVEWGFDSTSVGTATFYDQFSAQFVHKLPGGTHTFWVNAGNCGEDRVEFNIGS